MTGLTMNRMGIIATLILIAVLTLALVLVADHTEAQTPPPTSGDWKIYDTTSISGQRVILPAGLTVASGGSLTLNNVDIVFTHSSKGGAVFRVTNNGNLVITGGTIAHTNPKQSYRFIIENGGSATLTEVWVSNLYHNPSTRVDTLEGGMLIRSNSVTVDGCTFSNNERVAMVINSANPTIKDSNFTKSGYYSYSRSSRDLYREAYGIVVISGAPDIVGCYFESLGDYSTAFNDAIYGQTRTYLRLKGNGIYAVGGAPSIRWCHFEDIGRMHTSSSYRTYVEAVGMYVYFYFWNEDHRAAVMAINPLMLEVTNCNFTNNFQGYNYYSRMAYGIYLNGGKASIRTNTFWTNGGSCIYSQGGVLLVEDNEMFDFMYYGVYIYFGGDVTLRDLIINGTAEYRTPRNEYGLYLYRATGSVDIRRLNITFCAYGVYASDTALVKIYDSVMDDCTKKVYSYGSRVDCYNVTIQRSDIQLGYSQSEVNIFWNLDVSVTWQNGLRIPQAIVQIFNESNGLIKAVKTDDDGILATQTLLQTKMSGTSTSQTTIVNTPLRISAYANSTESVIYTVSFERNTFFQCIIEDKLPPNVEIYYPQKDHAQNFTVVEFRGIAVDVGSGLNRVEISTDDGLTWIRAYGGLTWNLSVELAEGVHELIVKGLDMAGAYSLYVIKNVTIDLTAPVLTITSPKATKNVYYTNQTTLTIIGEAEIGSEVFLNGEELTTQGGQFFTQISQQNEGLNTYEVMAVDQVGNRNITMLMVYQDITPPILLVEHPSEHYVTNKRVLEISGLTELDVVVTINELQIEVENGLFTMPMTLQEGLNVIRIEAVDLAKNHKYATLQVTYDIKPPNVNMLYPKGDEAVNHSIVVVSGAVDSDVSLVRVNQVPVTVRQGVFEKNFKLSEGDNLIVIEVTDWAGNVVSKTYTLELDTVPPGLVLDTPVDMAFTTRPTVTVTGRVDVGSTVTVNDVEVEVVGGFFIYEAPLSENSPGSAPNVLAIRAFDDVLNEESLEIHVFRDTKAPVLQVYTVSPETRSDFINITGSVDDPDDVELLTINDQPVQPDSSGFYKAYVPLRLGNNTFVISAVDAAGNVATQTVSVQRDPKLVKDDGIFGLGDASWMVPVLFLLLGLSAGVLVLYLTERKKKGVGA